MYTPCQVASQKYAKRMFEFDVGEEEAQPSTKQRTGTKEDKVSFF